MIFRNYLMAEFKLMPLATVTHLQTLLFRRLHSLSAYRFRYHKNLKLAAQSFLSAVSRRHFYASPPLPSFSSPYVCQQNFGYGRFVYDDYLSDEDNDREGSSSFKIASTHDNIEEWRWKLTMFMRNKKEHEVISRERRDRRDFQQLSALATRMGLYSFQYEKVIVISKLPLPNYRSDLDDKRPKREVMLSIGLRRQVGYHLRAHLSRKAANKENLMHDFISTSRVDFSLASDELDEKEVTPAHRVMSETVLRRRSLEMRNKQQDWQESVEGKKMQDFRQNLPAYKERDVLLSTISQNQVVVISGETGCGKTTQLPQYILESEIEAARGAACSIICTQPRRISAMSVSERVATERGEKIGESVGYKVRLEGMRGRDTHLLFCTTGVLLRRLLGDRDLNGVTHVITDEIHERGMNEGFTSASARAEIDFDECHTKCRSFLFLLW